MSNHKGFDKYELEYNEEFKVEHDEEFKEEHEVVSGPTNPPTKKLKSCLASKSKKVMKSPLKKTTKKAKNQW
jgi:hypothetical protein